MNARRSLVAAELRIPRSRKNERPQTYTPAKALHSASTQSAGCSDGWVGNWLVVGWVGGLLYQKGPSIFLISKYDKNYPAGFQNILSIVMQHYFMGFKIWFQLAIGMPKFQN